MTTIATALAGPGVVGAAIGFVAAAAGVLLLGFAWCLFRAPYEQRDALREDFTQRISALEAKVAEQDEQIGTVVPPGWNASWSGEARHPGRWFPPGIEVKMSPDMLHDDRGNTLSGGRIVGPTEFNNVYIG